MKFVSKSLLVAALLMSIAPAAARASDCHVRRPYYHGWRYHDVVRDRRDLRADWRDVGRDRIQLRRDIAYGNWYAARAQRADIARELRDIHADRRDLNRGYFSLPPQGYYLPR